MAFVKELLAACAAEGYRIDEKAGTASGVASGMGTCGLVGQIGVYSGWVNDVATGVKAAITPFDWLGLILISFVLPAVLCWAFGLFFRRIGWIKEGDLTLS